MKNLKTQSALSSRRERREILERVPAHITGLQSSYFSLLRSIRRDGKIDIPSGGISAPDDQEGPLEQAGSGLEEIVARSLRQVPPREAPLMAWPVVCGSAVAERTRALRFLDGVLQIGVPDYGWKTELQVLAPRYLAEVNRYTKEAVRKIDFVITPMDGDDNSH